MNIINAMYIILWKPQYENLWADFAEHVPSPVRNISLLDNALPWQRVCRLQQISCCSVYSVCHPHQVIKRICVEGVP
jgi:hypothetical protein